MFDDVQSTVAIGRVDPSYSDQPPYHPSSRYPEVQPLCAAVSTRENPAYEAVRRALMALVPKRAEASGVQWNPLRAWISPGDRVVIKPNWVLDYHRHEHQLGERLAMDCLVTHTSVLRAVVDYVQLALEGSGRVTIADAPLQGCDFDRLLGRCHLASLVAHYERLADERNAMGWRALPVTIHDMRLEVAVRARMLGPFGNFLGSKEVRQNDGTHTLVSLGEESWLEEISQDADRFRVTCYDPRSMFDAHRLGHHEYCVGNEILEADVVVNVPKLKTHRKAGVTVALKNLVGINGHKSYLPHHRQGSIADSGDEYLAADSLKLVASGLSDRIYRQGEAMWRKRVGAIAYAGILALDRITRPDSTETGSWYGNDTIWRTCLDLNRVLLFADEHGHVEGGRSTAARRTVLHFVDGIIGGEGAGPLEPQPKFTGIVMFGTSAPYVDLAAATMMGMYWQAIPIIARSFTGGAERRLVDGEPEDLVIRSHVSEWQGVTFANAGRDCAWSIPGAFAFVPPPGWEAVMNANRRGAPGVTPVEDAVRPMGWLPRWLARDGRTGQH